MARRENEKRDNWLLIKHRDPYAVDDADEAVEEDTSVASGRTMEEIAAGKGRKPNDGLLHHVGFTSAITNAERPALTKRLEKLAGGAGFTGRAPGGPSRWSTERTGEWTPLKPKLVVEVRYDHVTDARFRHGTTLLRWRPDKAPTQCTFDQLKPPAPPAEVSALFR